MRRNKKRQRIHISHVVDVPCPENVVDTDDVLMVETQQDLDFSQCALAVRLVLKGADFLDGYTLVCHVVLRGAGCVGGGGGQKKQHRSDLVLHNSFTVTKSRHGITGWNRALEGSPLQRCTCDTSIFAEICCEL